MERTVSELLHDADALESDLSTRLAAVEGHATGGGVMVSVNVDGRPIGLRFDENALAAGPRDLAERIQELATRAAADALAKAQEIVSLGHSRPGR